VSRKVLFVAGLFADEDDFSAPSTFAENGLRAAFPQIAAFAVGRGCAKSFQLLRSGKKSAAEVSVCLCSQSESAVRNCLVKDERAYKKRSRAGP
jgi:hypothetical protein